MREIPRRVWSLPILVLLAWAPVTPAQEPAENPEPIEVGQRGFTLDLEDQYGDPFRFPVQARQAREETADGPPPVTLLVTADRRGADDRRAWAEELRERYGEQIAAAPPELVVLPVAHLGGVPKIFRGRIVDTFFQGEKPTGLDWQGQVEAQLGLEKGTPNLAVFDREGTLVIQTTGPPNAETRDRVFSALDDLLGLRDRP